MMSPCIVAYIHNRFLSKKWDPKTFVVVCFLEFELGIRSQIKNAATSIKRTPSTGTGAAHIIETSGLAYERERWGLIKIVQQ